MGIVVKQSIKNIVITYFGFAIGAINTLFLFTKILSQEEFGVYSFVIAAANLLWPIIALGFHNTIIKYFKKFQLIGQQQQFFTWMLLIPTVVFSILFSFLWFNQSLFEGFYETNPILEEALLPIFLVAISFSYFEIYYAWAKAHLKSVEGNFLKQLFNRIGICVLLILVSKNIISGKDFLYAVVVISFSRTFLMKLLAYRIEKPVLRFKSILYPKEVAIYTVVILVVSMVSVFLLELDKVMIARFITVDQVAVYGIMVYIATVIEVPLKSMMQITTPLTSNYLEEKRIDELSSLNKSTSIINLMAAGLIALLIFCNAESIYTFIPKEYGLHLNVLFFICLVKLSEACLGVTSAIIYNSDYYRWLLLFGVLIAVIAIFLNAYLIPMSGLQGAAISTLVAYLIYNLIKLLAVRKWFGIHPFNMGFVKVVLIISGLGFLFRWLAGFIGASFFNLVVISIAIIVSYIFLVLICKVSPQVNAYISNQWSRLKKSN